jgi:DNA-directed RNA polymerase subunit RPC12/RpoP
VYTEKHEKYCRGLKNARLSNNGALCDVKGVPKNSKHSAVNCGQKRYSDSRISGNMNHIKQPGISNDGTCDGTSSQYSDFLKHVRNKLYHCHVYGQELTRHRNLLPHMRIQTEEKLHEGEECGHQLSTKSDVSKHRIHTREKPYECEECGRKFCDTSNLSRHMRIHTGEKPYECEECGRKFSQTSHLSRRMKIHTGEKLSEYDYKSVYKSPLTKHRRIHITGRVSDGHTNIAPTRSKINATHRSVSEE